MASTRSWPSTRATSSSTTRGCSAAYARVPRHLDGALDALVSRTALGMRGQRALGRLQRVGRHRDVVVDVDRADADRLAVADDLALHGGREAVAIERDLAPCQGATQSAEHSAGDAGHDVIQRGGHRRAFWRAVILAQRALHAVDDGLGHVAEIGVAGAV